MSLGRPTAITLLTAAALLSAAAAPSGAYTRPGGWVKQVDLHPDGTQPPEGASCNGKVISSNGQFVAFVSRSDQYVVGDTNLGCDVFVKNLKTGTVERVSVSSKGDQALGPDIKAGSVSFQLTRLPSISSTGRYVAFISHAVNLVDNDTNFTEDIFVHDRKRKTTERVSVASDGAQAELGLASVQNLLSSGAGAPSISGNGRFVAFEHPAQNLDRSKTYDLSGSYIFVRDREQASTELVSVGTDRDLALPGQAPNISDDGTLVSFSSQADFGVENQPIGIDVFVHDRTTHQTALVSSDSQGNEGSGPGNLEQAFIAGTGPADYESADQISADGRFVVFTATYGNLVPNDGDAYAGQGGLRDVFVKDLRSGRTERISVTWTGGKTSRLSDHRVSISDDGRYVAYSSNSSANSETGATQVSGEEMELDPLHIAYIYDRETGAVFLAARDAEGRHLEHCNGSGQSALVTEPQLSDGARHVLFDTCAENLRLSNERAEPRTQLYVRSLGGQLAATASGASMGSSSRGEVCLSASCIPAFESVSTNDGADGDSPADQANLLSVQIAYRPQYSDLFVMSEIEDMPFMIPGLSPVFYGLRFNLEGKSYEVRATSLLGGTFGLFDCTGLGLACTKVADLRGGYGTTGDRVVFSLPLEQIGLEDGGELSDVEAFSALGSYFTGATKILDTVKVGQ